MSHGHSIAIDRGRYGPKPQNAATDLGREAVKARKPICRKCPQYGHDPCCAAKLQIRMADPSRSCPDTPSRWGPYTPMTVSADSKP